MYSGKRFFFFFNCHLDTEWWKLISCVWLCIVHGILQARILEEVAFPFSRGSSQPRGWSQVSHIAGGFFTTWATREAQVENGVDENSKLTAKQVFSVLKCITGLEDKDIWKASELPRVSVKEGTVYLEYFLDPSECYTTKHMIWSIDRKAMTSLDSLLKSRDITVTTKDCIVKVMVFLLVVYGCESWTITKAKC